MAILYLDQEGGNDANDGLSFANRVKSINLGLTAARLTPGDTIRVIASPDPVSLGNGTWTDSNATIVLAAAKNVTIDNCEAAWTASTNVTSATNAARKQGSLATSIAPTASFTTGKLAYKTLAAPLDLSLYQQVSLWFRSSGAQPPSMYTLNLCSDATGDVVVNSLPFTLSDTTSGTANQYRALVLNYGAALGAGINSISLVANSTPGATTLLLDNIVACTAPSDVNCLTHLHLIGKKTTGEPEWYALSGIDGVNLSLGGAAASVGNSQAPRAYKGTTETVLTYALRPMYAGDSGNTNNRRWTESGALGSEYLISGGWNRTDMSTQTGESWFTGSHLMASWATISSVGYINMEKIGFAHFPTTPVTVSGSAGPGTWNWLGVVACGTALNMNPTIGPIEVSCGNIMQCQQGIRGDSITSRNACNRIKARRITGLTDTTGAAIYAPTNFPTFRTPVRFEVDQINNNGGYGLLPGTFTGGKADIVGTTFDVGGPSNTQIMAANGLFDINFFNCTIPNFPTCINFGANYDDLMLRFIKLNGDPTDNRIQSRLWSVRSQQTIRHTASGLAWQMLITGPYANVNLPVEYPLAQAAFDAGTLVTVQAWVYRDDPTIQAGLKIKGGYIAGVPNDVTVWMAAGASTWEQITLTFTPTEAGVIEVFGVGYNTNTTTDFNVYFDDLTITQ